ncbi:WASH complex subunit 2 [Anopheles coustani]|uniref:WASH complex subunit 2 n=1 Tax=Anopheles coustani TaxID=139045 RepID=UPI0026599672|nr:WASH complex subunit 2 [Anopheles coustani]
MALTPEELRQRIPNWSLESDGNLLQYMISIAKNLEEKCTKTRDNLNSLMLQVDQTELKLSNATNQFSAVEQVKFVENRVEEDDESFYGLRRRRQQQQHLQQQADEGKESSNRGQDPERSFDDLIQLAVERSIEGMYKSYEKVTLELTDSDTSDDEDTSEGGTRMTEADLSGGKTSIMRAVPRHPFIDRPLPHVIGSREWQNKWHVGLIDSDDESSSERKEEYSESSSQSDDDDDGGMFPSQPNSKNHTPSESESSIWGTDAVARKRAPSMDPSITGDDGSSVYSYASSSKPRALPNSLPVRGVLPIGVSLKQPSLFPEEPPEPVADDVKKRSDKGLFDESPDEEEEVEPAPMPTPRQTVPHSNATVPFFKGTVNQPARKMVNLFDDQPPSPQQQRGPLMPGPKKPINLFIESDDEEERKENTRNNNNVPDEAVERNVRHSGQPVTNPRTMTKLVDELNNNFRKQSGPAVRARNPEQRSSVGSHLFDAEPPVDDFDPLFNAAKSPTSQSALPQPAFRTVVEKKTVNLFADDDDDDDDGIVVGSNEKQPVSRSPFISPIRITPSKQPERKKKSIFDESDSDVENDNVGLVVDVQRNEKLPSENIAAKALPQLPKVTTKSIFSDSSEAEEDDEDALFGHSSNVVKSKLDALKRNGANSVPTVAAVAPVSQQRPTKNPPDEKKMAKKSLFDDESEDDNGEDSLFSSKPLVAARISSTTVSTPQKTTQGKVSLFDDLSFAEEDRLPVDPNRSSASIAQGTSSKMSTNKELFEPGIKTEAPEVNTNSTESFAVKPSNLEPAHSHAEVISVRKPVEVDPLNEVVSETMVPKVSEPPVGGSIRSIILKKSIFNSDSESEEDDSIFGPSGISIGTERASENVFDGLNTKVESEKCDTDGAQLDRGPREIDERSDVDKLNSKEVEIESIPQPAPPNGIDSGKGEQEKTLPDNLLDDDSTSTANKPDIIDPDVWDSQKSPSPAEVVPKETVNLVPADANKSIFDDSSSESESDPVLNMFAKKIKNTTVSLDQDVESETNSSESAPADYDAAENEKKIDQSVQSEDLKKGFAPEESLEDSQTNEQALYGAKDDRSSKQDLPSNSFADETTIPVDCETAPPEDEPSTKQSPLGMIANDIDYFLRTNEPVQSETEPSRPVTPPAVKSEPKSALNFSPIGLFDDVPPPDDEGDDLYDPNDHVVHQKHFQPGSTLSHADDIPTESQSLNFIPNGGSGSGNGARTRYLFDDEPPPDEADNGASSGFEVDRFPFKGTAGKVSLFENRPPMPDEPVSLPPMTQNVDKAQARPKVNKLNAKIAINVAALLPGARRPAPATTVPSTTGSVDSPDIAVSQESRPEVTASNAGTNGGKLTGLNKGRARIPTKRKPPSRQTLRAAAVPPTDRDHRKESDPAETDDRIVVGSEQKMLHIEAGEQTMPGTIPPEITEQLQRDAAKLDPLVDRLSASVRKPSATVSRVTIRPDGHEAVVPIRPAQPKVTSIFGDSSDSENDDDKTDSFFSKLSSGHGAAGPICKTANAGSRPLALGSGTRAATGPSIFGSDDEDDDDDGADDLFGSKKSTIAKHLKASKAGDLSGKPDAAKAPAAKTTTSLFGDDDSDNDDTDDLFGGKTKSLPKAPGGGNATGRPITSITTKTATTTRAVSDPLADLLDS